MTEDQLEQRVGWVSRRLFVGVTQHGRLAVGLRREKTRLTRPTGLRLPEAEAILEEALI